jgi:arylsulfatase
MQAAVGHFLQSFKEFPQRQKSASFNIEQVLARLHEGSAAGK